MNSDNLQPYNAYFTCCVRIVHTTIFRCHFTTWFKDVHHVIHPCGQCEANQTGEKKVTHSNCFHCHCWMSGILQEHNGANETQSRQQCHHSQILDIICEIIVISLKRGQQKERKKKRLPNFYISVIKKRKRKQKCHLVAAAMLSQY